MSNGSEAGSGACGVPLPGHMMPVGADALTEKGFRDWVASAHPVFAETKLADLLIEMGEFHILMRGRVWLIRASYSAATPPTEPILPRGRLLGYPHLPGSFAIPDIPSR